MTRHVICRRYFCCFASLACAVALATWSHAAPTSRPAAPGSAGAGAAKWGPEFDAEAPAVKPELLLCARVGGAGDQELSIVRIQGNRIAAAAPGKAFTVLVDVMPDGKVRSSV